MASQASDKRDASRYVAKQLIHHCNVLLVSTHHELWRVINQENEGMTEQELQDLMDANDKLKRVCETITHIRSGM